MRISLTQLLQKALAKLRLSPLWDISVLAKSLWQLGWWRSCITRKPVDKYGNPLPWMTYAYIGFMERKSDLLKPLSVFEWGSGFSTLWWAARTKSVDAVEYNAVWHDRMAVMVPENVRLHYVPLGRGYSELIRRLGQKFDVISIDGRQRVECVQHAIEHLLPSGVVVFDNSYREKYLPGLNLLEEAGFRRLDFMSLSPICGWLSETSLFYRDGNCLGI
jgi:hypothetical protein